jgi:hypothetical protein
MATIPGPGGLGFAIAAPYHGTVLATHGQVDISYSDQQMFIEPKGIPKDDWQLLLSAFVTAIVNGKDSTTGYMDFDIFVD